jgi:hypothetical protein
MKILKYNGKIGLYDSDTILKYNATYSVVATNLIWKSISVNSEGGALFATNYTGTDNQIYDADGNFITSVSGLVVTTPGSTHYDSSDNYYIGGYSGQITKFDKYNSSQWSVYEFSGSGGSGGPVIGTDPSLNVYIAGRRITGAGGTYSIKKYNSSGSFVSSYDTGSNVDDIKVDTNYVYAFSGSSIRLLTHTLSFIRTITGMSGIPPSFDIDDSGNIYALDSTSTPGNNKISKWNTSGTKLWTSASFGTIANGVQQMCVNRSSGYCYVPTNSPSIKVISPTGSIVQTISVNPGFAVRERFGYLYYGSDSVNKIKIDY